MNRHRRPVARLFCFVLFATGTAFCEVSRGSDGFLYAEVSVRKAAVPARFASGLPTNVEAFDGDWTGYPPRGQIAARICDGDPAAIGLWLDAIETAAAGKPLAGLTEAIAAGLLVVGSTHEAVAENKASEDAVLRLLHGTDIGSQDMYPEGE